jgi:hypothetical protein
MLMEHWMAEKEADFGGEYYLQRATVHAVDQRRTELVQSDIVF